MRRNQYAAVVLVAGALLASGCKTKPFGDVWGGGHTDPDPVEGPAPDPVPEPGTDDVCHAIDDENGLVAKFEVQAGTYVFEKPVGNHAVVTLTGADLSGGTWTSTVPIGAIVVKAGNGEDARAVSPTATSGTFDNTGLQVENKPTADISNIQFYCADPASDGDGTGGGDPGGVEAGGHDGCNWGSDWGGTWGVEWDHSWDGWNWTWSGWTWVWSSDWLSNWDGLDGWLGGGTWGL